MELLAIAAVVAGLWLAWKALSFAIARFETLYMADLEPAAASATLPPYLTAFGAGLETAGFQPGGVFQTVRGGERKEVFVGLWRSVDGNTLAEVEAGTFMGTTVRHSRLITRLGEAAVESHDEFAMGDPTGARDIDLLLYAGIDELLRFHARRLEGKTPGPPFADDLLAERTAHERRRAERARDLGLAELDPPAATWHWTWLGSWRLNQATKANRARMFAQHERLRLQRPGAD